MKFNLTVTDLALEEVTTVLTKLSAGMPVSLTPAAEQSAPVVPVMITVAAPAPVMAAPQPAPTASGVDSTGLPWDERIHASTKAVNADGTWKKRRGVQELQVNQVEAELRARGPVTAAPQPAPIPVMPQPAPVAAPAADPLAMFGPLPAAAPAPVMPQPVYPQPAPMPAPAVDPRVIMPQPAPAPVAAAPVPQARTFDQLMGTIQGLFNQQLIAPDYMVNLNQRLGVAAITDIAGSPERVEQAFGILKADGKIQ